MHLPTLIQILAFSLAVRGVPTPETHVLHEKRDSTPVAWEKLHRVDPEILLPVRVGLVQPIPDWDAITLLEEISHPDSPKYGQHYTAEQVHEIFAPKQESVEAVRVWLHESGIHPDRVSQSVNKQWIQFDATTGEVEALIHAEYHHYVHLATGKSTIGTDEYHVPKHLSDHHIDYITPGLKLLTPSMPSEKERKELEKRTFGVTAKGKTPILPPLKKALPDSLANILKLGLIPLCQVAITPDCIKALYNITKPTKAAKGNELGIFEDLNDKYSQTDLNEFFLTLAPNIPQNTHPILEAIDGATAPVPVTSAGAESDLDFEISYPIIYPQNSILYQTDDDVYEANYVFSGFLNNFLDALDGSYCSFSAFGETGNSPLDPPYPDPAPGGYKGNLQCGVYKPTNVISISYGGQEIDLPASYQKRQCLEYAKLGLIGTSVFVSSGDSGVGDPGNTCAGGPFSPDFPASCYAVTAVGSTFLPPGGNVLKDEEVATTRFPSGGGFSNIYKTPDYQSAAVANYLKMTPPPYPSYSCSDNVGCTGGIYNRAGRGYPDVSSIGDNVVIFNKGTPTLIGGTSASSPVWGAIITRVNEERIAVGKKPVGFLNPTFYSSPEIFHDITTGNNPGCGTNGFAAAKGWDPGTVYPLSKSFDLSFADIEL